jgi:hypothetical protein
LLPEVNFVFRKTKNRFQSLKSKLQTRFIKIKAVNYGKLPEWHLGYEYNGYAWIFCEEVTVE